MLEDTKDRALLLDNVTVAPAAQGKGHRRALIAFAEAEACKRRYAGIGLRISPSMGVSATQAHVAKTSGIAVVTGAQVRAEAEFSLPRRGATRFNLCVSAPPSLSSLSRDELQESRSMAISRRPRSATTRASGAAPRMSTTVI